MFFLRNYKSVILIVFLLIVALVILSYNVKYDTSGGFFRKFVLEATAPAQNALSMSIKGASDAWQRYILLVGLQEENKNLNKKIGKLEAELVLYKEGYLEALRLKERILSETDPKEFRRLESILLDAMDQQSASKWIRR